jgi:hypothetical protein
MTTGAAVKLICHSLQSLRLDQDHTVQRNANVPLGMYELKPWKRKTWERVQTPMRINKCKEIFGNGGAAMTQGNKRMTLE